MKHNSFFSMLLICVLLCPISTQAHDHEEDDCSDSCNVIGSQSYICETAFSVLILQPIQQ